MMCVLIFFYYFLFLCLSPRFGAVKESECSCYFEGSKEKISNSFQKRQEKPLKSNRKTGIFTQNQFSTKSIFLYGCNSITNHFKYLKF
ncbi:hypothetical protein FWK35_00006030, partial [Aphis craccivora]